MLAEWLESPAARARLEEWSGVAGLDLAWLGAEASQEEIRDTAITQPLVVASELLAAAGLREHGLLPQAREESGEHGHHHTDETTVVAGHSIGELAALAMAGVLSDVDAVRLAAARGAAMARACAEHETTMVAVLGGREEEVRSAIAEAGLYSANVNAAGQIVAAGDATACADFAANPPTRTKVRALDVAGAFHTPFMESAVAEFSAAAAEVEVHDPVCTLLSNADGAAVTSGRAALESVVAQITSPVRWDLCTQTQMDMGVSTFVELPPAGALTGIAKRQMRGVERLTIASPGDIGTVAGATQAA